MRMSKSQKNHQIGKVYQKRQIKAQYLWNLDVFCIAENLLRQMTNSVYIWTTASHDVNRSTFSENMKIALLGGTGETGVEVIFGQDKNKHNDAYVRFNFKTNKHDDVNERLNFNLVFSGDETSFATGSPCYPWGEDLYLLMIWGASLFFACCLLMMIC